MIPIVISIQQIFREKRRARMYRIQAEAEEKKKMLKRSNLLNENKIQDMPLIDRVGDEDYEYMTYMNYVNTRNNLQERI